MVLWSVESCPGVDPLVQSKLGRALHGPGEFAGVVHAPVTTQARMNAVAGVAGVAGCAVNLATWRETVATPPTSGTVKRMAEIADGPVASLDTHSPPGGT